MRSHILLIFPGTKLKKTRLMDATKVDFTGLKNVTCRKWVNSAIVLYWYNKLSKCVEYCSGIFHNLFLQSCHPFHTTWSFFVTITSLLVNRTLYPAPQSGATPMGKFRCKHGSM